ncbi:MAG TPA: protein kinase [Thermoanaerobaculia bacterium]|nr:protein kinase [Thermoanaerobaculia bacterium]
MQLESGTRLGPYEIVERVGVGGMGEVYRARDTRLSRDVAIKILPAEFASDASMRQRFEREAKTISALNHPHICTLHDVGRENDLHYLVMEYCEGRTLAHRLERGALPIDEVLEYGIQIAEALSSAHRAGIVHRDLKPSNIMLTKSGVKLLDFGLAKQQGRSRDDKDTTPLDGQLVGTVQYMAPEVLNGQEADARSDIFSLGLALYEMLTGKPAFSGTSKASVIASILEHDAPAPPPNTPATVQHVLEKCLAKKPDERWESAHDIAGELRWAREQRRTSAPVRSRSPLIVPLLAAAVIVTVATALLWRERKTPDRVVRFSISVPATNPTAYTIPMIAISPDGSLVAYRSAGPERGIHLRSFDSQQDVLLSGTEKGINPFFSPDGQWIGFVAAGRLMRVKISGGAPQSLFSGISLQGEGRGASWAPDGAIYFSPHSATGLWKVPATGGRAVQLTQPDAAAGENSHRWPEALPDGKHLLFTIRTDQIASFDDAKIAVLSLSTGRWKIVLDGGSAARYVSGHLLFGRAGGLYAVPFDLKSLTITGSPKRIVEDVAMYREGGAVHYAVSSNGDLAYLPGGIIGGRAALVAVDRGGRTRPVANLNFAIDRTSISPDGRKLAISVLSANNDIWLYDLEHGSMTRLTFEPGDEVFPVWTPDGSRILYEASQPPSIRARNADGSGDAEELLRGAVRPTSCSPDGRVLMYEKSDEGAGPDLWLLPLTGDRTPRPFLKTRFNEEDGRFSPDGKWVAYESDESGSSEIYVRSALPGGGRWQVSIGGGAVPRWAPDGKSLYYAVGREGAIAIYSVGISPAANDIRSNEPQLIVSLPNVRLFEATKDGVLIEQNLSRAAMPDRMNVVLNWSGELTAKR